MLGSFLEGATKLFGRRYVLTSWAPVFLAILLGAIPVVLTLGVSRELGWWNELDGSTQVIAGFVALVTISALAYFVQALPIVRFFEGYELPGRLRAPGRWFEQVRYDTLVVASGDATATDDSLRDGATSARTQLVADMPRDRRHVMSTRLGNIFRSAETYPSVVYGMDGAIWWPRLAPLLPTEYTTVVDEALLPVLALLTGSFVLAIITVLACAFVIVTSEAILLPVLTLVIGILFSWLPYRAAVVQARNYCQWFRTGFDLYRNKLWEPMRLAPPANLAQERDTWEKLERWTFEYDVPARDDPNYPPILFLDPPAPAPAPAPAAADTQRVRAAQRAIEPRQTAAQITATTKPNFWKRKAGAVAGVVTVAVFASLVALLADGVDHPGSERVRTLQSNQQAFGLLDDNTECKNVALPTDDAIPCEQETRGKVLATVVGRSSGDYLRARDVVELPPGTWTAVAIPAGSPLPTGGEPTCIVGTVKDPTGAATAIQVHGTALGRRKANLVVAITTADAVRLAPAIAGTDKTVVAVRALGAPAAWGSST